jgi:hypothetical protein
MSRAHRPQARRHRPALLGELAASVIDQGAGFVFGQGRRERQPTRRACSWLIAPLSRGRLVRLIPARISDLDRNRKSVFARVAFSSALRGSLVAFTSDGKSSWTPGINGALEVDAALLAEVAGFVWTGFGSG